MTTILTFAMGYLMIGFVLCLLEMILYDFSLNDVAPHEWPFVALGLILLSILWPYFVISAILGRFRR